MQKTILSAKQFNITHTVEFDNSEVDYSTIFQALVDLSLSMGYTPETVTNVIGDYYHKQIDDMLNEFNPSKN
jgi:hypothetical protein